MSSQAQTSVSHTVHPTGSDGITRCHCNEETPLRTAGDTAKNPGRRFYSCNKNRDDETRCKFFAWKDELDKAIPATPHRSSSQTRPSSSQPSPSQRQRADMARGSSTPSPQKRLRSPGASARRLANIEAALSLGGGSSLTTQKPLGQASGSHVDSLPLFDVGDQSEDDFFTASSSPPRHIADQDADESPRKKPRLDSDGSGSGSGGYMLMTPPRSDGNILRTGFTSSQPESPTKGKGKDTSQWEKIKADKSNPFHECASSLRSASQDPSTSQTVLPTSASVSNMTPESIKTLMSDLSTALPAYIAKLERKQVAMEKSDLFKRKKIGELEEENVSLRNRVRVLEETVSALKARRPLS